MLQFADLRSTNKELSELGLEVGSLYKKKRVAEIGFNVLYHQFT